MGSPLRRYFEGLLLSLLAVGFCTLASTGRLAWPVVLAAGAAFLARGYCFFRRLSWRIPPRWAAVAALLYLPIYVLDGLFLSSGFVGATLRFAVLAGAVKLFSIDSTADLGTARDYLFLGVLAFLEVLAAALLTVSGVFFLLFLVFLVLLVATLVAHEMAQAQAAAPFPPPRASYPPALSLLRFSLLLSLGVAMFSVLIFFLLPRTTLGAWAARRSATGLTGFSDEVRLGEIGDLQRTDTPVMHVRVTGSEPALDPIAFQRIPWRGRGLSSFDGQRWFSPDTPALYNTQMGRLDVGTLAPHRSAETVRYQVTLDPMEGIASPVLFFPGRLLRTSTHFPVLAWDRATATLSSLGSGSAGFDGISYAGVSDLSHPPIEQLRAAPPLASGRRYFELRPFLQLPSNLDPRIRALARSITAGSPPDNWDRMRALTQYLQANYQYTLDDLPQGPDPLASFLFHQRAGDCEYFASALAVMARSLSIPTRLVNGFVLGGYNPLSGEYIVRGRDAHSWVEAYFPTAPERGFGRGGERGTWMTFDATPSGGDAEAGLWPGMNMVFDALSSFWQEWIVNYDWMHQARLARGLQSGLGASAGRAWQGGGAAAWHSLWAMVERLASLRPARRASGRAAAGMALLAALLLLLAGVARRLGADLPRWGRSSSPEERASRRARFAYRRFQAYLRRAGCPRAAAQTAPELVDAVIAVHGPSPLAHAAAAFVATYEAVRFGGDPAECPLGAPPAHIDRLAGDLDRVRRHCPRPSPWRKSKAPRWASRG